MIHSYSSIIGTPLVDFNEGETLGLLRDIIIDPATGRVEAFWVKPVGNIFENLIVQSQDILEWKKKIYIRSRSVMVKPEDIVRIVEILKQDTPIIDQNVEGQSGKKYGKVTDLDFEDSTFRLRQICSQKRLLGLFAYTHSFFTYKRILEINSQKILVNDDATTKQAVIAPTLSET